MSEPTTATSRDHITMEEKEEGELPPPYHVKSQIAAVPSQIAEVPLTLEITTSNTPFNPLPVIHSISPFPMESESYQQNRQLPFSNLAIEVATGDPPASGGQPSLTLAIEVATGDPPASGGQPSLSSFPSPTSDTSDNSFPAASSASASYPHHTLPLRIQRERLASSRSESAISKPLRNPIKMIRALTKKKANTSLMEAMERGREDFLHNSADNAAKTVPKITASEPDLTYQVSSDNSPSSLAPRRSEEERANPEKYLESLLANLAPRELSLIVSKGDAFHASILELLLDRFAFKDVPIDLALRTFLFNFALPVEGQQIERVLSAFGRKYHKENPIFRDSSSVHILAVSLVMLNTDLFNPNQKMKFTKNTRGALPDQGIPEVFFHVLYENIKAKEFSYFVAQTNFSQVGWVIRHPEEVNAANASAITGQTVDRSIVSEYPIQASPPGISRPRSLIKDQLLKSNSDKKNEIVNILCNLKWQGLLQRKELKKSGAWKTVWGILSGENIYYFKDVAWFQARSDVPLGNKLDPIKGSEVVPKTESVLPVAGLICVYDASYTKHLHTIHLFSENGAAFILRASDDKSASEWMDRINYTAAFTTNGIRPDIFPRDKPLSDLQDPSSPKEGGDPRSFVKDLKASQMQTLLKKQGISLKLQNQSLDYVINLIAVHRFSKAKLQLERDKMYEGIRENTIGMERLRCYVKWLEI